MIVSQRVGDAAIAFTVTMLPDTLLVQYVGLFRVVIVPPGVGEHERVIV